MAVIFEASPNDPTWLRIKAQLEERRLHLVDRMVAQVTSDRDRADAAAAARMLDEILRAPNVAADRAARGT